MTADEEFAFELRRYLLERDAVVITREQLARLELARATAVARSDRDALAAAVKRVRQLHPEGDTPFCAYCSEPYPCTTVLMLDPPVTNP